MPETSVRVVARLIARADGVEEVRAALIALVAPSRRESGCISYELFQNRAVETDFTVLEQWETDAALDAHLETAHFREAASKLQGILACEPDIRRYRQLA